MEIKFFVPTILTDNAFDVFPEKGDGKIGVFSPPIEIRIEFVDSKSGVDDPPNFIFDTMFRQDRFGAARKMGDKHRSFTIHRNCHNSLSISPGFCITGG